MIKIITVWEGVPQSRYNISQNEIRGKLQKIHSTLKLHADFYVPMNIKRDSLIAQLVKNPPAMQETPVRFLGWEDLLEKGEATHSSILGLPLWLSW